MKKRKKTTKKGPEQISRQNEMVFNAASEGIYGLDLNGNLTFINRATARMLGWDVEELISKRGHDVLHHSRLDGTPYPPEECPIYSSFKDGIVRFVDNEVFWRKDGTSFPVNYTSTPIWEDGKPIGAIVVFKDVTTEGALRENLAQLSKKNRYESIISTVTRSIHQSINLQEVLENTVEAMKQNIDSVDSVSIFLVEGQEAVLKAYSGLHPDWLVERVRKIPYPKGAIWNTIIEGKPIYCADVDQDTVIGPAGREAGIKSYLIIPIRYEGKTVGILNINSLKKNAFDEEELKLLESVAQQCQIAINKAKQAEALRKALQEVEQLKNQLQAENIYLQEEIKIEHNFEEIVGESESLKNVLRNVEKVAPTETTVLIQGERPELVKNSLHAQFTT